jgi:hypothetical protein
MFNGHTRKENNQPVSIVENFNIAPYNNIFDLWMP